MSADRVFIPTYCAQCTSVCGVYAVVRDGRLVDVTPMSELPGDGSLCPKAKAAPEIVYHNQRLKYPMKRTRPKGEADPGWVKISWDEALTTVASRLTEIKMKYGAEAIYFHRPAKAGSASMDHDEWVSRLANAIGSPNLLQATHICNWHRDVAARFTYGTGTPYPDMPNTRCLLLWGTNPWNTNPRQAKGIEDAKSRGASLIVVDPRLSRAASEADLWLQPRPGSDIALILSMIDVAVREGLYDYEFVAKWTNGPLLVREDSGRLLLESDISNAGEQVYVLWDRASGSPVSYDPIRGVCGRPDVNPTLEGSYEIRLKDGLRALCKPAFQVLADRVAALPPERVEEITWVKAQKIREAARLFLTVKPAAYWSWNGIEKLSNAVQTSRALCILYSLTGNFGKPGGNALPFMTGTCTYVPLPTASLRGAELLPVEQSRKRLGLLPPDRRPLGPPGTPGNVSADLLYKAILTRVPYPVKAGVVFGGDSLLTQPDTSMGREALKRLDFLVVAELFETPVTELADIVLPASTFWECEYVRAIFYSEHPYNAHAMLRKRVVPPQWESWPDVKIVLELAKRLGLGDRFWNGDLEAALNHMLAPIGLSVQMLRDHPHGVPYEVQMEYERHAKPDSTGRARGFDTPTGRIELYSVTLDRHGHAPLPSYEPSPADHELSDRYPFLLTFAKAPQFCHSAHHNIPSLRRDVPDPYIEMNPRTAKKLGVADGDWVKVENRNGSVKMKARLTDAVDPRVVYAPYGWYQACDELRLPAYDVYSSEGANVNLILKHERTDPISGSCPHSGVMCNIRKA